MILISPWGTRFFPLRPKTHGWLPGWNISVYQQPCPVCPHRLMICSIVLSLRLFDSFSKELGRVHVSVCSGDFQLSNCIFLNLRTGIVGSLVQEGVCRVLKGNRTTFVHSACTLVAPWKTNEIGHSLVQNYVPYRRLLTCLTGWFALVAWTRTSFNYEKLSQISIMNNYVNKE